MFLGWFIRVINDRRAVWLVVRCKSYELALRDVCLACVHTRHQSRTLIRRNFQNRIVQRWQPENVLKSHYFICLIKIRPDLKCFLWFTVTALLAEAIEWNCLADAVSVWIGITTERTRTWATVLGCRMDYSGSENNCENAVPAYPSYHFIGY